MASSHDDVYEKYDCRGSGLWAHHNLILFADGGNFLLGFSRVVSFLILFALNRYNQTLLRSKDQENTNVIPSLILPYYFTYFKLFIALSFLAGVIDIAFQLSNFDDGHVNNWLIPIEQGLFHWLYEGLAFFLLRYGAGFKAMSYSLFYSGIWGVITVIIFFILFSMFTMQYGMKPNLHSEFALFLTYDSFLLAFYLALLLIPERYLYRRGAIYFYASFNVCLYSVLIILGSLLYRAETSAICPGSALIFIFVGFLQPLVLFRTLQIDSRYWQGLTPDPRNPMLEVWDHVGIDTAQSMAEQLESIKTSNRSLPILHFGLLDIETNIQYISGGFSRVYFGTLLNQKVALKILFAMELTPDDVKNFYHEASLLHSLAHPNIVECKGICTMPPALAMVLENCKYGSLYDFLYKPTADPVKKQIDIRSAISGVLPSVNMNNTKKAMMSDERLEMTSSLSITGRNSTANPIIAQQSGGGGPVSINVQRTSTAFSRSTSYNPSHSDVEQPPPVLRGSGGQLPARVVSSTRQDRQDRFSSSSEQSMNDKDGIRQSRYSTASANFTRTYESFVNMVSSTFQRSERPSVATITMAHGLSMMKRLCMMKDAVAGIAFLHERGFLHCDIKSLNFLVDEVSTSPFAAMMR